MSHPNITIQRSAFLILSNLVNGTDDQIDMLVECDILGHLNRHLYEEQTHIIKGFIIHIFFGLVREKSTDVILKSDLLQTLISMLSNLDDFNLMESLKLISNLALKSNPNQRCTIYGLVLKEVPILLENDNKEIVHGAFMVLTSTINKGLTCEISLEPFNALITQIAKQLVKLVFNKNDETRIHAVYVLSNIAKSNSISYLPIITESGFLEYVNELLQDQNTEILYFTLTILNRIAITDEKHLISDEVLQTIVQLLDHENQNIYGSAIMIAANLSGGKQKGALINFGALKKINEFIEDPEEQISLMVGHFLTNILKGGEYIQLIFDEGYIPQIIQRLKSDNTQIYNGAANAIAQIIGEGTPKHLNMLIEMGMLTPFCAGIHGENTLFFINSISRLLNKLDEHTLKKVCMMLEENECMPQIRHISETHENQLIRLIGSRTYVSNLFSFDFERLYCT